MRLEKTQYSFATKAVSAAVVGLWVVIATYILASYPHLRDKKIEDYLLVAGFIIPFLVATIFFDINIRYPKIIITISISFTAIYIYWFKLPLVIVIGSCIILSLAGIFSWLQIHPPENKYLQWIAKHFGEVLIILWVIFWMLAYFDMYNFGRFHFDFFEE